MSKCNTLHERRRRPRGVARGCKLPPVAPRCAQSGNNNDYNSNNSNKDNNDNDNTGHPTEKVCAGRPTSWRQSYIV